MTRWMFVCGLLLALGFGAAIAVGTRLPVAHTATVSAVFPATVETAWTAVTDFNGFPIWRSGVDAVERLPDMDGAVAWTERGSAGELTMMVEESVAPSRFVTRIVGEEAFGGTWTFTIAEERPGSRVTITEDGEIYNAFFRFLARYVIGYDGTMTAFLEDLQAYLAEQVPVARTP